MPPFDAAPLASRTRSLCTAVLRPGVHALCAALLLTPVLAAQGRIGGRVTAADTRAPIAGAEVLLVGADTLRLRSDADGAWRTARLARGTYRLRVRAMGYAVRDTQLEVVEADIQWEAALAPAARALDQLVVTASRRAQRLGDAVTTVEVVSRADLERTGAADLSAVLTEHTGIELQGGHPAGAGVMLQGIGSERVLILLDGQPVAGRLSGTFDISRIPVAMVERVEVVKGAQSTLYGSEAMGGVVNIITRPPASGSRLEGSVLATAGEQGRRDVGSRLTVGRGALAVAGDVSRRYVETAPGVEEARGALAARLDGALKVRWAPDSARHLEFNTLALDERQRWRTGSFYGFSDNVQVNARVGGAWTLGRHRVAPGLSLSHYEHTARASAFELPIAGDTGQRQVQRVAQAEVLYAGTYSRAFLVDAGVQLRVDEIDTERVPGGRRHHTSLEPFAQVEWRPLERVSLVPGLRVSQSNVWGTQVTPRLAARARVGERLTLRASLGDGFRAPDFKELFLFFQNTSAGYAVQGNPALRPERSRSASVGAEYALSSGYLRVQVFENHFRQFIESQIISAPGEAPVYEYANRDNGWTRGGEAELGANLVPSGRLRGELGWSTLATRDVRTGRELLGRPSHSARALVSALLPGQLRASVTLLHTGRTPMQRDDSTGAVASWREAFTRVDARVTRALPLAGLEFVAGADNLFDRRPAEWAGFTGRHVYTSLSYSFSRALPR